MPDNQLSQILLSNVRAEKANVYFPRSGHWVGEVTFLALSAEEIVKLQYDTVTDLQIDDEIWKCRITSINQNNLSAIDGNLGAGQQYIIVNVISGIANLNKISSAKQRIAASAKDNAEDKSETAAAETDTVFNDFPKDDIDNYTADPNNPRKTGSDNVSLREILAGVEQDFAAAFEQTNSLYPSTKETIKRKAQAAAYQQSETDELKTKLSNIKVNKDQDVEAVAVGPQLSKLLKDKIADQNVVWRNNRAGEVIFSRDRNPKILSWLPSYSECIESKESYSKFSTFYIDHAPDPGTYVEITNVAKSKVIWRVGAVHIYAAGTGRSIVLWKNDIVNKINKLTTKHEEITFAKSYSSAFKSQNEDGTINIYPNNNAIRGQGLANIAIIGPYGSKQFIRSTETVPTIQYHNNDPALPYVIGFDQISDHNNDDHYIVFGAEQAAQLLTRNDLLQQELAALRTTINNLINTFNNHIHTTTATVGSSATPGVIAPTTTEANPHADIGPTAAKRIKSD